MLSEDYIGYKATDCEVVQFESSDSAYIRERRRLNARVLQEGLSGKVDLMFNELGEEDCPLHVPVAMATELRAATRKALIQYSIYCPCHWPVDTKYPYKRTRFHDEEISLICDQRYTREDMAREVEKILRVI